MTTLFLGLTGKSLLSDGMFTDGVTYAVLSRNLAEGLGALWDLRYTETLYPHFHEHPPLAFWIQSLFFRIFGDHIFVERIYSAGTFFITAIPLVLIWRRISPALYRPLGWLLLLFWISAPIVTWAASNNLLENTLMIFTGFSVLLILKGMPETGNMEDPADPVTRKPDVCRSNRGLRIPGAYRSNPGQCGLYLLLAGLLLGCGFLTKGFVALFPLSLPFWIFLFHSGISLRRAVYDTAVLFIGAALLLIMIILLMPGSRESLDVYLNDQVIGSITGERSDGSRFHIIGRTGLAMLPGILLLLAVRLTGGRLRMEISRRKWFFVFLALGLSAVLPIMISMKQRDFYILPAMPFLALAMAMPAAYYTGELVTKLVYRVKFFRLFRTASILLLMAGVMMVISRSGKVGRDQDLLKDVHTLADEIPDGAVVCIPRELFDCWELHAYLHRYGKISMDPGESCTLAYYLAGRDNSEIPDQSCSEIDLDLLRFRLLTCSPVRMGEVPLAGGNQVFGPFKAL